MDPTLYLAAHPHDEKAIEHQAFYEAHATDPLRPLRRAIAALHRAIIARREPDPRPTFAVSNPAE